MKKNETLIRKMFPNKSYRSNLYTVKCLIDDHILIDDGRRHYLDYHFANETIFARDFIDFVCALDAASPGAAKNVIQKIGSVRGETASKYEQIVQSLCELIIAKKFTEEFPCENGYQLSWEPTDANGKNPEFMITCNEWRVLVEVKTPSLSDYNNKNRKAKAQLVGRLGSMKDFMQSLYGEEHVALPLDNKIKDYLISAEAKFSSFAKIDIPTYGLLFICWGERMFEAITPLSNPACGFLCENSHLKKDGEIVKFPHITGVIVTQHQLFLRLILAERYQHKTGGSLGYGEYWGFGSPPNPSFSENPFANHRLPKVFKDILQTVSPDTSLDPLSRPTDFVYWL